MATTHRATEADLWERSRGGERCELVDGEIREMTPAGARHGNVAMKLGFLLSSHVRSSSAGGSLFDSSTGFRMPNGNVRAPDLAFVMGDRVDAMEEGFVPCAPDLAVEILSPSDEAREVLDKVGEYLQAGTRVVWVVDPRAGTVVVHRSVADVVAVGRDGELEGGDVLPGFRCRPADFL